MWYWKAKHWLGDSFIYGPFLFRWMSELNRAWHQRIDKSGKWSIYDGSYYA